MARVWSLVGSVVAPVTLVTAILFYFGYVSSRAQYLYFGIDVDLLGFSTQDFVMRSPQPLLVPMLAVLVLGAVLVLVDAALRRRMSTSGTDTGRAWARALAASGGVVLTLGVALLVAYTALGDWALYPLVTPLVIGAGAGLLAYGLAWRRRHPPDRDPARGAAPADPVRTAITLLVLTVVAALFWTTATVAEWSGRARAKDLAADLTVLPAVVLDTTQRLETGDPVITESALPADEPGGYRYRYRGLRLLVEGDGTLFLVPEQWTERGSTLVAPLDDVRVRFRFVNDPPGSAAPEPSAGAAAPVR
ncbi:hypothetical protein [Oerskovia turbata]